MGKVYAGLDDRLRQFIVAQPVFFVATAPAAPASPATALTSAGAGHLS